MKEFEPYKCEHCGKLVTEKYGSGRFCSRTCANARTHSVETRYKIHNTLSKDKETIEEFIEKEVTKEQQNTEVCPICGFKTNKHGMRAHYAACKRKHGIKSLAKVCGTELDITVEDLNTYIEEHPRCEICGKTIEETVRYTGKYATKRLCIDHDHQTGHFRGMLCQRCNRQLGWFENYQKEINDYLNK